MKKNKETKTDESINMTENTTETQYVDEFGNPIDPSLIDESGNYIGSPVTQYVDEFGNPIDPSLIDEFGNYIGNPDNVQSESLNQSQISADLGVAAGNEQVVNNLNLADGQEIHTSEHQMDDKEMFSGMVTFDYNNVPITDIVNSIILDSINKGASDIHFDPFDEGIKIRIRIDGELNDYSIVPLYVKKNMITRIKIISGMNITESRTPQDGAIRTELANKTIDLRVSCLPTNLGEKIVIRIMDYSMSAAGIEGLDFNETNLDKVKKMVELPNGIILVTGATGTGKSTTVYSMLQRLNKENTNIITVEDPIEMNIGGINQVQTVSDIGLDFATVLRSILRQDPDVIMIGEIRDEETAKIAVRASITGHLVLSTIHTNNSLNTIERLTDMNVERYLLGSALSGIISQKLSRRLCDKCKKLRPTNEYEKDLFKKLLNKDVDEIYGPVGCPECSKGYRGRIAIQEVLLLNQSIKDAIIKGANKQILRSLVYGQNGTETMLQDGLEKVLEGKTSFEEILKLIDLDDDLGAGTELGLTDQIEASTMTGINAPQTLNGPININITPELLAGLQVATQLEEDSDKSIFSKFKKKKKKVKEEKENIEEIEKEAIDEPVEIDTEDVKEEPLIIKDIENEENTEVIKEENEEPEIIEFDSDDNDESINIINDDLESDSEIIPTSIELTDKIDEDDLSVTELSDEEEPKIDSLIDSPSETVDEDINKIEDSEEDDVEDIIIENDILEEPVESIEEIKFDEGSKSDESDEIEVINEIKDIEEVNNDDSEEIEEFDELEDIDDLDSLLDDITNQEDTKENRSDEIEESVNRLTDKEVDEVIDDLNNLDLDDLDNEIDEEEFLDLDLTDLDDLDSDKKIDEIINDDYNAVDEAIIESIINNNEDEID